MSTAPAPGRWLLAALLALLLLAHPGARAAVPESWKASGWAIDTAGLSLRRVLDQFGQVYGVRVAFGIPDVPLRKERLRADSGVDFLDRLAQPYHFRWFVYGDTLHIVARDDQSTMRLEVGEDAVQDAKGVLTGMGLFDSRFGWGELPDEGVVVISGPAEYVRLAREILLPEQSKAARKEKQFMLFRLKYASATDRVISARGRTETIPGIKTILLSLTSEPASSRADTAVPAIDMGSPKRSRKPNNGKGEARQLDLPALPLPGVKRPSAPPAPVNDDDDADAAPAPARAQRGKSAAAPQAEGRPRIEADPSLNAIMVYDLPSRRAMYQSLIDQLDLPPQQIEIEALIVDIERSRLSELGVEWGVGNAKGDKSLRVNGTANDSQGIDLPLPGSTLLISNAARFYARLKALEGSGEAHILGTPTVLTLNNVAAVLDLSQTRYVPLLAERYADLADISAGTMLRVIPRIVQDGAATRVRLEVDIEDGALGNASGGADVTRSTISTQAIVDMQQTLMIGGYRAESLTKDKRKLPGLGDLPVLGGLFRNDSSTGSVRERLFLITPRLVDSGGVASAAPTSRAGAAARRHALSARAQARAEDDAAEAEEARTNAPAAGAPAAGAPAAGAPVAGTPTTPAQAAPASETPATPASAPAPAAAAAPVQPAPAPATGPAMTTAPVAAPPPAEPLPSWEIGPDDRGLKTALTRWAAAAGWQMLWELPVDYGVSTRTELHASFKDAVAQVVQGMEGAEVPMKAIFYEGNRVLRIVVKGTE